MVQVTRVRKLGVTWNLELTIAQGVYEHWYKGNRSLMRLDEMFIEPWKRQFLGYTLAPIYPRGYTGELTLDIRDTLLENLLQNLGVLKLLLHLGHNALGQLLLLPLLHLALISDPRI